MLDAVKGSNKEEVSDQDTKPEHNMLKILPIIPFQHFSKNLSIILFIVVLLSIILILFFLL